MRSHYLLDDAPEVGISKGHAVKVETAAEIIAKKMYHRGIPGNRIFLRSTDLCHVIEREPVQLLAAKPFLLRHPVHSSPRFGNRIPSLRAAFDAITHAGITAAELRPLRRWR